MRRGKRWLVLSSTIPFVLAGCSSGSTSSKNAADHAGLIVYARVVNKAPQIWAVDPTTAKAKYVAKGTSEGWSSDGASLLVLGDQLSAVSPTDLSSHSVPNTQGIAGGAAASPDGTWIAFEVDQSGNGTTQSNDPVDIDLVHPDGKDPLVLSQSHHYLGAALSWSADSNQLVVSTGDDGIWTIATDGTGTRRLTPRPVNLLDPRPGAPTRADFDAAWAPNANRIAFVRYTQSNATERNAIYAIDPNGQDLRKLSPSDLNAIDPVWSPDGSQIAFVGSRSFSLQGGTAAIYVMAANGSDAHPVTPLRSAVTSPTWSADGSQIAYVGTASATGASRTEWGVFVTASTGGAQRNVATAYPPQEGSVASWQP